jgi:hypothetical protein
MFMERKRAVGFSKVSNVMERMLAVDFSKVSNVHGKDASCWFF